MSILIKGVDLPKHCADCDLHNPFSETPYCRRLLQVIPLEGRLENCPLVEVNVPHGKLIDTDKVLEAMDTWDKFGFSHTGAFVREPVSSDYVPYVHYEDMVKCVENMPAVIESEEL